MGTIAEIYPLLRQAWTILFLLLFALLVWRALRPSRRAEFERHGMLPLRDED